MDGRVLSFSTFIATAIPLIQSALRTLAPKLPTGELWLQEIKQLIVRRAGVLLRAFFRARIGRHDS